MKSLTTRSKGYRGVKPKTGIQGLRGTWRPVEHPGGVVLHLRLLEVEVLGLVVGDAHLHALAVGLLGSRFVGRPLEEKDSLQVGHLSLFYFFINTGFELGTLCS